MARTQESKKAERHPWRENLETAAVAIVMALVLKYFTLEAFQIPTGSMQPTLMGLNTGGAPDGSGLRVYDRILVDKLIPFLRDPRRWEIWVFLYPLDRSSRYIKRVVGLPGEELKIKNGDIFVRNSPGEDFRIVRKPPRVQESMWRQVWESGEGRNAAEFWDLRGFEEARGVLASSGRATADVRRPAYGPAGITDSLYDGYPEAIQRIVGKAPGRTPVRDLRLRLRLRPSAEHRSLVIRLGSGGDQLRCEISGPSGDGRIRLLLNDAEIGAAEGKLRFNRTSEIAFSRADEAAELSLDGETVLRREFGSQEGDLKNSLGFETDGGSVSIESVAVDRDTYYTNQILGDKFESVQIPEGMYFMLGDNSQQSADGRFWKEVEVRVDAGPEGPATLTGGSTTSGANSTGNPRDFPASPYGPRLGSIFRDRYGEEYRYVSGRVVRSEPWHFVPRAHFLGRAFFVFWPLPPFSPSWRLGPVR